MLKNFTYISPLLRELRLHLLHIHGEESTMAKSIMNKNIVLDKLGGGGGGGGESHTPCTHGEPEKSDPTER